MGRAARTEPQKNKRLKYRYFFLSFSVSFLILSILFLGLMSLVHPTIPKTFAASPVEEEPAYEPLREDAITVLFVGIAPDEVEADTFLLVRMDPVGGTIPVTAFPRQTLLLKGGKSETLADAYRYGGAEYTRDQLSRELGIPIDRYVRMDMASFVIAADTVGSVEFELPRDISLGYSGSGRMVLSQGMQLLDGRKAADIIHYDGHSGGELTRCAMVADLTAAIINQRIDISLSTIVDKVFEKIINLIDTDISYPDYDTRKDAAQYLAQLETPPAQPITVSGTYSKDHETYALSDTFVAVLAQNY